MLDYDRIDISEGIGIKITNDLHEYRVLLPWYNFKINLTDWLLLCNDSHELLQKPTIWQLQNCYCMRKWL